MDFPHVRTDLWCPEHKEKGEDVPMRFFPESKYGPFYGCVNYPDCKATHGAHRKGSQMAGAPLGIPATTATKQARIEAHAAFDVLWKNPGGIMKRGDAYVWMQQALGLTKDEAHIGNFDIPTCTRLAEAVQKKLGK